MAGPPPPPLRRYIIYGWPLRCISHELGLGQRSQITQENGLAWVGNIIECLSAKLILIGVLRKNCRFLLNLKMHFLLLPLFTLEIFKAHYAKTGL